MSSPALRQVKLFGVPTNTGISVFGQGATLINFTPTTLSPGQSATLPCTGWGTIKVGNHVNLWTSKSQLSGQLLVTAQAEKHGSTFATLTLKNDSGSAVAIVNPPSQQAGFPRLVNVSAGISCSATSDGSLTASLTSDSTGYAAFYITADVVDVAFGSSALYLDCPGGQQARRLLADPSAQGRPARSSILNVLDFDTPQEAFGSAYDGATIYFPAGEYIVPPGGWSIANQVRVVGDKETSASNASAFIPGATTECTVIRPSDISKPVFTIGKGTSSNGISFERFTISPFIGNRTWTTPTILSGSSQIIVFIDSVNGLYAPALGQSVAGVGPIASSIQLGTTITAVTVNTDNTITWTLSQPLVGIITGTQTFTFGSSYQAGGHGIYATTTVGSGSSPANLVFRDMTVAYMGEHGIYLKGQDGVASVNFAELHHVSLNNNYGDGLRLEACTSVEVWGGYIANNQKCGVRTNHASDITLVGTNIEHNQLEANAAQDADKDCQLYIQNSYAFGIIRCWFEDWITADNFNRETAITIDSSQGGLITGCQFLLDNVLDSLSRGIYLMNSTRGVEVGTNNYHRLDIIIQIQASAGCHGNTIGHQTMQYGDDNLARGLIVIPEEVVETANTASKSGGNIVFFSPNGVVTGTGGGVVGCTNSTLWRQQQIAGVLLPKINATADIQNPRKGMLIYQGSTLYVCTDAAGPTWTAVT